MKFLKKGSKDHILMAEEVFDENQKEELRTELEEKMLTPQAVVEKTFDEYGPITNRTKIFSAEFAAKRAQEIFTGDVVRLHIAEWNDYAWRSFYNAVPNILEYSISRYPIGGYYRWHVDHAEPQTHRVLNFIYYMNTCEGGELDVSTDYTNKERTEVKFEEEDYKIALTVKPREGLLVMFPSHYPHRVRLVESQRDVLHGHLCF